MRISMLLLICNRLDIPATAFFEIERSKAISRWEHAALVVNDSNRMTTLFRRRELLRHLLDEATREQPAPSLPEIAKRLGYKQTGRLTRVDPALCLQIRSNFTQSGRKHAYRQPNENVRSPKFDLRQILEQSLSQDLPVPVKKIATSLGYADARSLREKCPTICTAISRKIAARNREDAMTLQKVIMEALEEMPPPTLNELKKRRGDLTSYNIKLYFPELYKSLMERRKMWQSDRILGIRNQLEVMLAEFPAPSSLAQVEKRVGMHQAYLVKSFPELYAALIERCLASRREAASLQRALLVEEVRTIVQDLSFQKKNATFKLVRSLLRADSIKDRAVLSTAIKAAKSQS